MKIAVIANGEWDVEWGKKELLRPDIELLIGADGGTNQAISSDRIPDVVIGDLDSITEDNLETCRINQVRIIKYPKQKDETDLELAMTYAAEKIRENNNLEKQIVLYAGGGKRIDHLLGNISLMLGCAEKGQKVIMSDPNSDVWVLLPGKEWVHGQLEEELSIIPVSESAIVSSGGLFYELNHLVLSQNSTRGISNVLTKKEVWIEVHQGKVLIVKHKYTKNRQ